VKVDEQRQDRVGMTAEGAVQAREQRAPGAGHRHLGDRRHRRFVAAEGELELLEGMARLRERDLVELRRTDTVDHVEQGAGLGGERHVQSGQPASGPARNVFESGILPAAPAAPCAPRR